EDLGDIINKNGKMLRRLIRENVEIRTELLAGPLPVLADRAQIEQILMNLASNAQDAMPDGGTLTIATHRLESLPEDSPATSRPDISLPCALLTVADTGTGIAREQVERVFDPFFTTKEVGHGTGLGLAQVYGTVQQHHGVVTVASKPGEGTLFSIFLPLHSEPAVAPAQGVEKKSRSQTPRPLSILLVEDEPQVRRVLKRLLGNQGHHIREADNGREATRLFQKCHQEIDLIIMDVIMPEMNGKEAYEEMIRLKPDLKILFISGYPGDIISVQHIREKKFPLLAKPLDPTELMHKIKEITEGEG
ncbi:MAG: response regulator, partial [Desulfurivibrionaceae bacterium]|nr:response regulator [Desulfurivibrionaceae bacterium]